MTTQIKPRPLEENASYTRFGHNSSKTPRDVLFAMDAVNRGLNKSIEYLNGGWSVGDVRMTGRLEAQDDWVFLVGQTIGIEGSNAVLTGDDYNELYELAKNWAPNTGSEVWSNSDLVTLPDMRGRGILAANNMGGQVASTVSDPLANQVGNVLGAEKTKLTINELPAHKHTTNNGGYHGHSQGYAGNHNHSIKVITGPVRGGGGIERDSTWGGNYWQAGKVSTARNHKHSLSAAGNHAHVVNNTGGSQAHNNMQPSIVFNVEMKY